MFGLPVDGTHLGFLSHSRSGTGHRLSNGQYCFGLTQTFWSINPAYPQFGYHRALDAANWGCGAPIRAARSGMAYTSRDIYGALIVTIIHDATWRTTYGHLSRFAINNGVWVNQGQVIGYNGTTGLSSGCHLHFEVIKSGVRVDPWPLLNQNIVKPAPAPATVVRAEGLPANMTFTSRYGWRATIIAGKPRRNGATLASANLGNTTRDEGFPVWGEVAGQNWGVGGRWFFGPQSIGGRWRTVYIPLVDLKNRNF
jgi:hypothetical protein